MPADRALAECLLGRPVDRMMRLTGSGNNRLYRLAADGSDFALKLYEAQDPSGRQRFSRETTSIRFLANTTLADRIPNLVAVDEARSAALFDWIPGDVPAARGGGEIDQIVAFVEGLVEAGNRPEAQRLMPAAAACFSLAEIVEQVDRRRSRLDAIAGEPALTSYLCRFDRFWHELRRDLGRDRASATGKRAPCVLSPSDFGFHNALRRSDGRLVFLDFEYFGWDDPAKLAADILWHPGMPLSLDEAVRLRADLEALFGQRDAAFARRLTTTLPAYGLCWCMILLNEFLPERWGRRCLAQDVDPEQWASVKQRQLAKAEQLIARVEACRAEIVQ